MLSLSAASTLPSATYSPVASLTMEDPPAPVLMVIWAGSEAAALVELTIDPSWAVMAMAQAAMVRRSPRPSMVAFDVLAAGAVGRERRREARES